MLCNAVTHSEMCVQSKLPCNSTCLRLEAHMLQRVDSCHGDKFAKGAGLMVHSAQEVIEDFGTFCTFEEDCKEYRLHCVFRLHAGV